VKADEIRKLGEELGEAMNQDSRSDEAGRLGCKLAAEFVAQLAEMNARFARDAAQFDDMIERGKGVGA
jgi:hypothetical protein